MKTRYLLIGFILAHALSACNGGSSSFSPEDILEPKPYNLASSRFGAMARSDADSENAGNIIDGDVTTYWRSEPDIPIVIELKNVEDIIEFRLEGEDFPSSLSTQPDILIEFSKNGKKYEPSLITMLFTGIPCTGVGRDVDILVCQMDPATSLKFIRITSQNGKSFMFNEVTAIALK